MTWDATATAATPRRSPRAPASAWYLAEGATHSRLRAVLPAAEPERRRRRRSTVEYLLPAGVAAATKTYSAGAAARAQRLDRLETPHRRRCARPTSPRAIVDRRRRPFSSNGRCTSTPGPAVRRRSRECRHHHARADVVACRRRDRAVLRHVPAHRQPVDAGDRRAGARTCCRRDAPCSAPTTAPRTAASTSGWISGVRRPAPAGRHRRVDGRSSRPTDVPFIVERAMWWPAQLDDWREAHNSPGSLATGATWGLADGEVGGARPPTPTSWWPTRRAFAGRARHAALRGRDEVGAVARDPPGRTAGRT